MPKSQKPAQDQSQKSAEPSFIGQTSINIDVAKCLYGIAAIIAALNSSGLMVAVKALF